jgi:hypothetical protein
MSEIVVAEMGILPGKRDEALAALEEICNQTHANDEGLPALRAAGQPGR